jgi:long-chain acyl-CoA synthetase
MNINGILNSVAALYGDKTSLIVSKDGTQLTYRLLTENIGAYSSFFIRNGITKNENVAVKMKKSEKWAFSFFGLLNIGANPVLIDHQYTYRETSGCLEASKTHKMITDRIMPDIADKLEKTFLIDSNLPSENAGSRIKAVDIAGSEVIPDFRRFKGFSKVILFTYRGFGYPLAVSFDERSLIKSVYSNIKSTGVDENVIISDMIPSTHIFSLTTSLLSILFVGGTVVMINNVMPGEILRSLERYSVNLLISVPSLLLILMSALRKKKVDLSACKKGMTGGSELTAGLFEKWREITGGCVLVQGYGLTETCPVLCNPWKGYRTGTIGKPMHATSVRIMKDGKKVDRNKPGILFIRRNGMMDGYLNGNSDTEKILSGGWFDTGDIASMDDEGFYHFHGRDKQIAKIGGATVDLNEVKSVIESYPHDSGNPNSKFKVELSIEEDPVWQEKIICKITSDMTITKEEMFDHLRSNLSGAKIPKEILIIKT